MSPGRGRCAITWGFRRPYACPDLGIAVPPAPGGPGRSGPTLLRAPVTVGFRRQRVLRVRTATGTRPRLRATRPQDPGGPVLRTWLTGTKDTPQWTVWAASSVEKPPTRETVRGEGG